MLTLDGLPFVYYKNTLDQTKPDSFIRGVWPVSSLLKYGSIYVKTGQIKKFYSCTFTLYTAMSVHLVVHWNMTCFNQS